MCHRAHSLSSITEYLLTSDKTNVFNAVLKHDMGGVKWSESGRHTVVQSMHGSGHRHAPVQQLLSCLSGNRAWDHCKYKYMHEL